MNRDIIDLAMMIEGWGSIPHEALAKAQSAYGSAIIKSFARATETVSKDRLHLATCLADMQMDPELIHRIPAVLQAELHRIAPAHERLEPLPPASELIAQSAGLREFLNTSGATVQQGNYESGHYLGRVVWADDKCFVQAVGRGIVVIHPTSHWHAPPTKDTYARIRYEHGVPDWAPSEQGRGAVQLQR